MNLPGFYALGSAWLFLLLIPLIVFYFLKLKRPRLEISSLALWQQVINDRRVNSPFQKFKRNLLLLLQLMLLCFLILAAMQPFLQSGVQRAEYLPILIDCSASMAGLDTENEKSRLNLAKEKVAQLIDNMLPDQRMSLIAMHSTAQRLTEFTSNKRLLHKALAKLTPLDVPSRLEDALRMTQALSRTVPIDNVTIFSDGNFPGQVDFELPFQLNYQQLPPAGKNLGITSLNARRSPSNSWDVFVRVEGSETESTSADVQLFQNGKNVGEETVVLEPKQSQRLVFHIESTEASSLEVRLIPVGFDSLESDNNAFLELTAPRALTVFTPLELASYRHALAGLENLELFPINSPTDEAPSYDLLFSDRQEDLDKEASVALYVGLIPPDLQNLLTLETALAEIVDWQRAEPILRHVMLTDVQISQQPTSAPDIAAVDFENLGYSIIAHGRTGPLILKKKSPQKTSYYLLFHTDQSTLPYRVGFPILVSNLVDIAMQQANLSEIRGVPTSVLPPIVLEPKQAYRVTDPQGNQIDIKSSDKGVVSGIAAMHVGRYIFRAKKKEVARVGVSLLNAQETSLSAVQKIQFRELSIDAAETSIKSDRPLWPTFALLAFGMLLVEWWFFQKRASGGT